MVTSGEIVPVIARKSSSYKTVEAIDTFVLSYVFMFIFYAVHKSITPTNIVALTIVAMLVTLLMFQFKFLKRIFVPKNADEAQGPYSGDGVLLQTWCLQYQRERPAY